MEAELATFLAQYPDEIIEKGRRVVARIGYWRPTLLRGLPRLTTLASRASITDKMPQPRR